MPRSSPEQMAIVREVLALDPDNAAASGLALAARRLSGADQENRAAAARVSKSSLRKPSIHCAETFAGPFPVQPCLFLCGYAHRHDFLGDDFLLINLLSARLVEDGLPSDPRL